MTLVVGKLGKKSIYMLSDTKITDLDGLKKGLLHGALKTVILRPNLCVSYAGNVSVALKAIRNLPDSLITAEEIVTYFLASHQENKGAADYMVALLNPHSLDIISDGKVSCGSWIGDIDAFNAYQTSFSQAPQKDDLSASMFPPDIAAAVLMRDNMDSSMRSVIQDSNISSVGDFLIRVIGSDAEGFIYLESSVGFNFKPINDDTTERQILTTPADTTNEGFNYSVLVPSESGVGAIGVHFIQGEFGCLYFPKKPSSNLGIEIDPPTIYKGDINDFIQAVEKDYGILLRGIPLTPQGFSLGFKP